MTSATSCSRPAPGRPRCSSSTWPTSRSRPALRYGVLTHNGEGEAVSGTVMMLLGANSRDVVHAVGRRVEEIRRELPLGVSIDVIYDRADFVGRTLKTVVTNLAEGVLIVMLVLALFLGTLRGAVAVVLGIPAAMSVALIGMHVFGVTGDLMSLGAIDFGFLVDGPIVILEAVVAATAGRKLVGAARAAEYGSVVRIATRPVAFAVAIIMLVYVPLLTLEGVEGKMFRPMALTMATALFGALALRRAVLSRGAWSRWCPRARATVRGGWTRWRDSMHGSSRSRSRGDDRCSSRPSRCSWWWAGASAARGRSSSRAFSKATLVVTIRRAPSISLAQARDLDLGHREGAAHASPRSSPRSGMTGRAEVADRRRRQRQHRHPRALGANRGRGRSARDFDELSVKMKDAIESRVPGTFVSVSQPIEDRTNEIISGSRADVSIQTLWRLAGGVVAHGQRDARDCPRHHGNRRRTRGTHPGPAGAERGGGSQTHGGLRCPPRRRVHRSQRDTRRYRSSGGSTKGSGVSISV